MGALPWIGRSLGEPSAGRQCGHRAIYIFRNQIVFDRRDSMAKSLPGMDGRNTHACLMPSRVVFSLLSSNSLRLLRQSLRRPAAERLRAAIMEGALPQAAILPTAGFAKGPAASASFARRAVCWRPRGG